MAAQPRLTPQEVHGRHAVLVGTFRSGPRAEIVRALQSVEVKVDRQVTAETAWVIVGLRSWAIRRNGRVSRSLMVARLLQMRQVPLQIISEAQFCQEWGELLQLPTTAHFPQEAPSDQADDAQAGFSPSYSIGEWQRAKLLADWLLSGIPPQRIERALQELGRWIPAARTAWERLGPRWDGRRLILQLPNGSLCDHSGQLLLSPPPAPLEIDTPATLALHQEDAFSAAVRAEAAGDFATAEEFYRQTLLHEGPDIHVSFNLANVLVERGQRRAAMERLWQCVESSPQFVEAWYNLGLVALELQETTVAREVLQQALHLAPGFTAARRALEAAEAIATTGGQ